VEGSEPVEVVAPGAIEAGPRSSATAEATVEVVTGEAPVHGAERASADVSMEEVASASGQEAASARGRGGHGRSKTRRRSERVRWRARQSSP
jgi:hypothetical protein